MSLIGLPLPYSWFWIAVWASALLTGVIYLVVVLVKGGIDRVHSRFAWTRVVGLVFMAVPAWIAVFGFINSIPVLSDPDSFIPPRSRYRLSSSYIRSFLIDLGYLSTGFLLWTADKGWPRRIADLAGRLRDAGLPLGRGEWRSAFAGFLGFPVLAGATLALDWFVNSQAPSLISGDESQIWVNMTPYHAVMISAAAAVTEELVYRGFLLVTFMAVLQRMHVPPLAAGIVAVLLQAIVFGAAHGGYGTYYHVIGPTLFALIAGFAALRWGIWAPILLHFLIDLYAFGSYTFDDTAWMLVLLVTLLLINVAATVGWAAGALLFRWRKKRSAQGEI